MGLMASGLFRWLLGGLLLKDIAAVQQVSLFNPLH